MLAALLSGLTLAASFNVVDGQPGVAPPSIAAPDGDDDDHSDDDHSDDDHSDDSDDDDGDGDDNREQRRRRRFVPPSDEGGRDDDEFSAVFIDSSIGCGLGGALPALGTATGLGVFYGSLLGGNACGSVISVVGGISGALVAIPSVLLLGPCAAGGATCGAAVGAAMTDKDIGRAVQWSLPGVGAGLLGGGVATAGLLVSTATNPELRDWALPVGTTLVVVGTLLASAGGPLSVAGATITQADERGDGTETPDRAKKKTRSKSLRDGGLQARADRAPPAVDDAVAMAW